MSTTFNQAVNASGNIDLNGTAFNINNTVTSTAGGTVTITNSGLLDIAATGDMNLDGAFVQDGAGNTVLAGDITTSDHDIDFAALGGTLYIDGGITATTTAGNNLTWPVDIHIYAPAGTISLPVDNLTCNNLLLYSGNLDLNGNNLTTNEDLVLLGGGYNDDGDVWEYDNPQRIGPSALAAILADNNADRVSILPGGAPFAEGDYAGTVADLDTSIITVNGNFYANGCNLNGNSGDWTLNLPPNDNALSSFAEAYNLTVDHSKAAGGWVAAAENVTDGNDNTNWSFTRTAVRANPGFVYTVYDNVIRIEFDELIENTNDEITAAVNGDLIFLEAGRTNDFTQVYKDRECSVLTTNHGWLNEKGETDDISVFYLRIDDNHWNTDAVSNNAGAAGSRDRTDNASAIIPQIHFRKDDAGYMYVLQDQYKNRIEAVALSGPGDIEDQCRPVLLEVVAGIEAHDLPVTSEADAHNYFDLRYSEPVNIGTLAWDNGDSAHNRSEDVLTLATLTSWDIEERTGGTVTLDSFFTYSGNIDVESRDGDPANSIYRDAGFIGGNTHGVRIYLNGYSTLGAAPDFFWPGYTVSATNPAGAVLAFSDADVADIAGNQVEPYDDDYDDVVLPVPEDKGDPIIAGSWDVDPPGFANYSPSALNTGAYEIVARANPVSGIINRLEFHIFDDFNADDAGWDSDTDHRDFTDGIRFSSLTDVTAFTIEEVGQTPLTSDHNLTFDFDVNNSLFGTFSEKDDAYIALNLNEEHGWNLLSELYISYDSSVCPVTDLAGNLLPSATEIKSIERIPPYINLSLANVGGSKVYIKFSEPVFGFDGANLSPLNISHFNPTVDAGLNLTGLDVISLGDNGGVSEAFLSLSAPLDENQSVSGTLKANLDSIADKLKNAMLNTRVHRVTDVAAGIVEPVWATDSIHADDPDSSLTSSLRDFDGTGKLMDSDITLETSILADLYTDLPVQLYYDVAPDDDTTTESGLWLPSFVSIELPTINNDARGLSPIRKQGAVRDFRISGSDDEIVNNADLEFILKLGNLFTARSLDPTDPRKLAPWVIPIRDIVRQAEGVTILNNVINPAAGDKAIITYETAAAGMVTVNVFNLAGDLVDIIQRGAQGAGIYTYRWDGTNRAGNAVARGIYFIRVVAPGIDEFRKVMVVK